MNRWWKGIVLLLLLASLVSTWIQVAGIQRWISVGGRFTDIQGQELCEVVVEVAKESYGYLNSGRPIPICNYYKKDQKDANNQLK